MNSLGTADCGDIDESYNPDLIQVSRCDCVCFIMLAIGAQSSVYPTNYKCVVREYDEVLGDEKVKSAENYYVNNCRFKYIWDLVNSAVVYAQIANGEYRFGENGEYIFFNTYRNITVEEAVAFMIRCLEEDRAVMLNLEETFSVGIKKGLIKKDDIFVVDPKRELCMSEFRILLDRFLDMSVGWYDSGVCNYSYDGSGTRTYRELLADRYTYDFINSLLTYDGSEGWLPGDIWEYSKMRSIQRINENKIEVDKILYSDDEVTVKLKSYSILWDILDPGKGILYLDFEVANVGNKNISFLDKLSIRAYQNNDLLWRYGEYDNFVNTVRESILPGSFLYMSYNLALKDTISNVTLAFLGEDDNYFEYQIFLDVN